MNVNEMSGRFSEDDDDEEHKKEHHVVVAELIVTNKLLENVIADAAERLLTIRQMALLGLELDNDQQSSYFLFKAIRKIAMYPMSSSMFEEDFDDE